MRLNKFIATATGISRRKADEIIASNEITVNNHTATTGFQVNPQSDVVLWKSKVLQLPAESTTIILNKPIGYVCSRYGQGSKTIYDLLPPSFKNLKPIGRLDKDSSGLLIMSDDGDHVYRLSHPSFNKKKTYLVELDKPLTNDKQKIINDRGIILDDGKSQLNLATLNDERTKWRVVMSEGRNRQIRRTFEAAGSKVVKLHRTKLGPYQLGKLKSGEYQKVSNNEKT